MVEPRQRRALAAEPRIVALGTGLAVQAGRDHDEVRLVRREVGVAEAPASHRSGCEVLGHDVCPLDKADRDPLRLGMLHVQRDGELVRVERREHRARVETLLVRRDGVEPEEVGPDLGLDADHGRAVVGEVSGRERPGGAGAELEDLQAEERLPASRGVRSGEDAPPVGRVVLPGLRCGAVRAWRSIGNDESSGDRDAAELRIVDLCEELPRSCTAGSRGSRGRCLPARA